MHEDFLGKFLGNQNRARILRVFVLDHPGVFTVSQMAKRSGVNSSAVTNEIKALEQLGVIKKAKLSIQVGKARRVVTGKQSEHAWSFDLSSRYAVPMSKFIHEVSPVHYKAIISTLRRSGRISALVLSGSFVGDPTRPADLIVAADSINESRLDAAVRALEPTLGREIRYAAFSTPEFRYRMTIQDKLIRDTLDYPHVVLLDKLRIL